VFRYQCSALADDGLGVVAGDIVELDSVIVEVVEDSQARLITFSVVRLSSASSSSVGPLNIVVGSAGGPADPATSHIASCPEESLTLPHHQPLELSLLGSRVQTDCSHTIGSAEGQSLTLGEVSAAQSPAEQVVPALELEVGRVSSSTPASSSSC